MKKIEPRDLKVGDRYTRTGGGQEPKDFEVIEANEQDLRIEDLGSTRQSSVTRYTLRNYTLFRLKD